MLGFGIVVCVLMLGISGYLAYRNSKLIAEKKQGAYISVPPAEYTVYMTKVFTEEDRRTMVPLGSLEYHDLNGMMRVVLCRVTDEDRGDLKLEEAGSILINHVRQSFHKGTFRSYHTEEGYLQGQAEIQMADRIAQVVGNEMQLTHTNAK